MTARLHTALVRNCFGYEDRLATIRNGLFLAEGEACRFQPGQYLTRSKALNRTQLELSQRIQITSFGFTL